MHAAKVGRTNCLHMHTYNAHGSAPGGYYASQAHSTNTNANTYLFSPTLSLHNTRHTAVCTEKKQLSCSALIGAATVPSVAVQTVSPGFFVDPTNRFKLPKHDNRSCAPPSPRALRLLNKHATMKVSAVTPAAAARTAE